MHITYMHLQCSKIIFDFSCMEVNIIVIILLGKMVRVYERNNRKG